MKTNFEKLAFKVALQKLLKPDGHFCIIDFDALMKLAGVPVPSKTRDTLRALHCVSYCDMGSDLKRELVQTIMGLLQSDTDPLVEFQDAMDQNPPRPQISFNPGWLQKLLGRP